MNTMKTNEIVRGFLIFITLFYGFLCDDLSEKCVDLIVEMSNCSMQFHVPENCTVSRQSELFKCAESVAQRVSQCPDVIARKMINHYVTTYKQSDSVICDHNLHAEFINSSKCLDLAQMLVVSLAHLTPGFITTKGCKFFKSLNLIIALSKDDEKCYSLAKDYVDLMYSKSTCSNTKIEIPTREHFENFIAVIKNIGLCWMLHHNVTTCDSTKSGRLQCIEDETLNHIKNKEMRYLEDNILLVEKKTDEVLCENEQLKLDFDSNPDCVEFYMLSIQTLLMTEINGFFTEEGCRGVQYKERYRFAIYEEKCRPILHEYWTKMKKVLPCVVGETQLSIGVKINGRLEFVMIIIALLTIRNTL